MLDSITGAEQQPAGQTLTREQALVRLAISDYITLTKPRIISLLLIITFVPMFLASGQPPDGMLILWTLLGGFLAAGGANAINQFVDRDIDHVMVRTRRRPLPAGRLTPARCLPSASLLSVRQLRPALVDGQLTGGEPGARRYSLLRLCLYLAAQTQQHAEHRDRRRGGAVPPLVGWAAVTGEISLLPIILFLIVFYWTPPHFWALALMRQKEYRAAGVPMLPVVAGDRVTHNQIVVYSVLLTLISFLPVLLGYFGPVYAVCALALNGVFLYQAIDIRRAPTNANIWRLYKFSLLYLALLFVSMGIDHLFVVA